MSREKIESTDWLTRDIPKEQLERKKRVAIMSADLQECHTEFFSNAELYTDYDETARQMDDKGYRKQSEVVAEFSEAVKHIAEGVKFKNDTEKTAFIEMLDDLTRVKMKGGAE